MIAALIHRTGWLTDPGSGSDLCGARPRLEKLAGIIHADLKVIAWDDPYAARLMAACRQQYSFLAITGHSFGGSAALTDALFAREKSIDALAVIDECPPGNPLGHLVQVLDPPASAKAGCAFWQRNSEPSGVAFNSADGFEVYNVSDWKDSAGRKLGHANFPAIDLSSIAGDEGVWDIIESVVSAAFSRALLLNAGTGPG